jgi:hypothetical protein
VGRVTRINPCQIVGGPLVSVVAGELQRWGRLEAGLELSATTRLPAAVDNPKNGPRNQRIADEVLEQSQPELPRQRRAPETTQLGGADPFRFQWRPRTGKLVERLEPRSPERLAVKQFGGQGVCRLPDQADARVGGAADVRIAVMPNTHRQGQSRPNVYSSCT